MASVKTGVKTSPSDPFGAPRVRQSESSRDREMVTTIRMAQTADPWYRGPRDPVLGSANVLDHARRPVGVFLRDRDYNEQRDPVDRQPIPRDIHTRRMDRSSGSRAARLGSYNGGLEWSPAFREYMSHSSVYPQLAEALEHTDCWQWWKVAYVHKGVLFCHRSTVERQGIAAILAIHRDGMDRVDAAILHHLTVRELAKLERQIALFAHHHFGLPNRRGPEIPSWERPAPVTEGEMEMGQVAG